MPSHRERQLLPYSPRQMFALVADVEHYPLFLPWCRAARVIERREGEMLAELVIAFKGICESYTSRVMLHDHDAIDVTMVQGPFEHLTNQWRFNPLPEGGTEILFELDFRFRSRLLETLIGGLFGRATERMVGAFRQRAEALYGTAALS